MFSNLTNFDEESRVARQGEIRAERERAERAEYLQRREQERQREAWREQERRRYEREYRREQERTRELLRQLVHEREMGEARRSLNNYLREL